MKGNGPPAHRKQLHILYLLHDTLHHTKYHSKDGSGFRLLSTTLHDGVYRIVNGLSPGTTSSAIHQQRLTDLIQLWENGRFFDDTYIQQLREAAVTGAQLDQQSELEPSSSNGQASSKGEVPFIMPSTHGDPSTPFYDLPAGNMIPHIIPNSTHPINPQHVKPLQFTAGPAEQTLVLSVKAFLEDIESANFYSLEDEGRHTIDIDDMGQVLERDNPATDLFKGEAYYGWSREFCEKIKKGEDVEAFRNRVQNDHSEERDSGPYKRRRYSYSQSNSSISRSRSRSTSRARMRGPDQGNLQRRPRSRSRSRSQSYSPPSPPPSHTINPAATPSAPRDALRERSPPYDPRRPQLQAQQRSPPPPPPPSSFTPSSVNAPSSGIPSGPSGVAIPPRPMNYTGPWPPPPPPPNGPRIQPHFQHLPHAFSQSPTMQTDVFVGWNQQQQMPAQAPSHASGMSPGMQGHPLGTYQNGRGRDFSRGPGW